MHKDNKHLIMQFTRGASRKIFFLKKTTKHQRFGQTGRLSRDNSRTMLNTTYDVHKVGQFYFLVYVSFSFWRDVSCKVRHVTNHVCHVTITVDIVTTGARTPDKVINESLHISLQSFSRCVCVCVLLIKSHWIIGITRHVTEWQQSKICLWNAY